jgi:thymidylate kinase
MLRKLSLLMSKRENEAALIWTSMSHGDFTPWNMYEKKGRLHIYDWELSRKDIPLGFDAFHFIIQHGILASRKNWTEIQKEVREKLTPSTFSTLSNGVERKVDLYLKLYLILNTISYLNIYSHQVKWHTQISWLLDTWNQALSAMASTADKHRSLVLTDAFDSLQDKPYAALKFPDSDPWRLSEYSDVDLCIDKSALRPLVELLSSHPLVCHARLEKKSFMATLHLTCCDGSFLSVDLIWKLKRKITEMMKASSVIKNSITNEYGVKRANDTDQARYIGLFYTLNNTGIPQKYRGETGLLEHSSDPLDKVLYTCFQESGHAKPLVKKLIGQKPENLGINKWKNTYFYLTDTIRGALGKRGMVITFSGVDGAGKSTVIDNVRMIIEKKLRRKVVVIRHRPSILPILSAWTKGKAAAEKEAASTLPRQGQNKHLISSMLRFGYYYSDYLFGQFVVYFRHVLRGHVVLYDRYYFDFINDSRRSNLQVPAIITRSGYSLLIKPDLNFFLYADPQLILARKKELDAVTIEQLTKKYLDLFDQLNRNKARSRYIPIENIVLQDTVDTIINRMLKTAA